MKSKHFLIIALLCATSTFMGCQTADTSKEAVATTENSEELSPFAKISEETMDEMIKIIREKHFSTDTVMTDWDAVRAKHRPAVIASKNVNQLTRALTQIVDEIKHSHVGILPPENKETIDRLNAIARGEKVEPIVEEEISYEPPPADFPKTAPGEVGMRIGRTTAGKLRVITVQPGSTAEKANIKVGDEVISIASGAQMLPAAAAAMPSNANAPWFTITQMMLSGRSGTKVNVVIKNSEGKERKLRLTRRPNGLSWCKLGVMPPEAGGYMSFMNEDKIGYIAFTPCMPSQIVNCRKDIRKFAKEGMKGLVLDFRGNPGGLGIMTPSILGCLITEKTTWLYEINKFRTSPSVAYPQKDPYLGPVAVLTDNGSASSSEMISAGIKDTGRGATFGQNTAGSCLGSNFIELKSEFRLQTVLSDCRRLNGKPLEKDGVEPTEEVLLDDASVASGKDPVFDVAVEYINRCNAKK